MSLTNSLLKLVFGGAKDNPAELPGLTEFLLNSGNHRLAPNFSKRNLEDSVLELSGFGLHQGNGLLITRDGYFVTALHCLQEPYILTAKDCFGDKYRVERLCEIDETDDIALAKLHMTGPNQAIPFRVQEDETYSLDESIMLYTRWEGKIVTRIGILKSPYSALPVEMRHGSKLEYFPDHASAKLSVIGGDSGGTIINQEGQLLGILSSGGKYSASYIESDNIMRLVSQYAGKLKSLQMQKK